MAIDRPNDALVRGWLAGLVDALGAMGAYAAYPSADGLALEPRWAHGYPAELTSRFERIELAGESLLTDCFLGNGVISVDSEAAWALRYPTRGPLPEGNEAMVAVPLPGADGAPEGVLGVGFATAASMRAALPAVNKMAAQLARRIRDGIDAADVDPTRVGPLPSLRSPSTRALSYLSVDLLSAATTEDVVDCVTTQARATFDADWVGIGLLDDDKRTVRIAAAASTPAAITEQHQVGTVDGPLPLHRALREDRLVLIRTVAERDRYFPALAAMAPGLISAAAIPMRIQGRVVGGLAFGFRRRQHFTDDQIETIEQIARITASALERIRRSSPEPRVDDDPAAERRLRRLQSVADQVASAADTATLAHELVASAAEALEATSAAVALFDEQTLTFTMLAQAGTDPSSLLPQGPGSADNLQLTRDLMNSADPILIGWPDEYAARYPTRPETSPAVQGRAYLPLLVDGRMIGAVAFAWSAPRAFSEAEVRLLATLGQHTAAVLDRSRLLVSYASAAESLQRAFLPELHPIAGWDIAGYYRPAFDGNEVGGDWYDVFPLPPDRMGLVIGDVAGKGLRAAAVMGALRSALRAYAAISRSPAEVFAYLDAYMAQFKPNDMVTCFYGILEPATGRLAYARAGQPPPLVVNRGGSCYWLDEATGPPLGAFALNRRRQDASIELDLLGPEPTLLLYSDGLIEQRRRALDEGMQTFARAAALLPRTTNLEKDILALALEVQQPDLVVDDQALLAFRRT